MELGGTFAQLGDYLALAPVLGAQSLRVPGRSSYFSPIPESVVIECAYQNVREPSRDFT